LLFTTRPPLHLYDLSSYLHPPYLPSLPTRRSSDLGIEWGTPIPLPDQTLLLGLGAGKKTPSWDESKKEFVPKTEAQITTEFSSRSEEHTSELQSPDHLVCRLLLEKKKQNNIK